MVPSSPVPRRIRVVGSGTGAVEVVVQTPGLPKLKAKMVPPAPSDDASNPAVTKNVEGRSPNCVSMFMLEEQGAAQPPTNHETICPWFPVVKKMLKVSLRVVVTIPSVIMNPVSTSVAVAVPIPPAPKARDESAGSGFANVSVAVMRSAVVYPELGTGMVEYGLPEYVWI